MIEYLATVKAMLASGFGGWLLTGPIGAGTAALLAALLIAHLTRIEEERLTRIPR